MRMTSKPGYQETVIGWVPANWSVSSLGAVGLCIRGVSYKPEHLHAKPSDKTVTLLRSNNIRDSRVNLNEIQLVSIENVSTAQLIRPLDIAICMSNGSKSLVGKSGVVKLEHLAIQPKLTVGAFCSIYRSSYPYVSHIFQSSYYQSSIDIQLSGSAINNLKGSDIEGIQFPWPPLPEQKKIDAILTAVDDKLDVITLQIAATKTLKQGLTQTLFTRGVGTKDDTDHWVPHRLFKKYKTANYPDSWKIVSFGSVAPIIRRPVEIESDAFYPELGLRSFGKGTFHKPALAGKEVGNKRLFKIQPGDLLFSNVFAWEGSVAVAKKEDEGRFGSHRYITCKVDNELANTSFVFRYITTPDGIELLKLASPGGAGRNRTLGLSALAAISIPLPPLKEQDKITEILDGVDAKLSALINKQAHYQTLKRGLMQKLLSGEWRVKLDDVALAA